MAKVKALKSFAGAISMHKGEIKEVNDEFILNDLLNAKYIEVVEKQKTEKTVEKAETKTTTKKSKKGDK